MSTCVEFIFVINFNSIYENYISVHVAYSFSFTTCMNVCHSAEQHCLLDCSIVVVLRARIESSVRDCSAMSLNSRNLISVHIFVFSQYYDWRTLLRSRGNKTFILAHRKRF